MTFTECHSLLVCRLVEKIGKMLSGLTVGKLFVNCTCITDKCADIVVMAVVFVSAITAVFTVTFKQILIKGSAFFKCIFQLVAVLFLIEFFKYRPELFVIKLAVLQGKVLTHTSEIQFIFFR